MALLRNSDIKKLSSQEKKQKINALKFELVKGNVSANKTNAKTKEIKKAIARLLTDIKLNSSKEELRKK